ncbi:hypothetical protein LSH36_201g03011 [Paralvinella palmiformis]|uniref:Uncharacterized protein n=1 Tax=Paralvinella palmiformis TaxID=53620 RepID=A0AAD9JQA6_9ANNE|nr:hypothetical protein LSH36_201g03011 [Paralvinella palmiformis]
MANARCEEACGRWWKGVCAFYQGFSEGGISALSVSNEQESRTERCLTMSDAKVTTMKASHTKEIPIRRVLLSDPSQLPSDYSQTPGGTLFSTTPGGKITPYYRSPLTAIYCLTNLT